MNHNRISGLTGKSFDNSHLASALDIAGGFILNPIWSSVTPEQMLLYQAAYQQAAKETEEESDWPMAENWN